MNKWLLRHIFLCTIFTLLYSADNENNGKSIRDSIKECPIRVRDRYLTIQAKKLNSLDGILDITDIQKAKRLDLSFNQISEIGLLKSLTHLTELDLSNNKIKNIKPLASLVNVSSLVLSDNRISSIERLCRLCKLKSLYLPGNQISEICCSQSFINVEILCLNRNQISDIMSLKSFINLKTLYLSHNPISQENIELLRIKYPNIRIIADPNTIGDNYMPPNKALINIKSAKR